MDKVCDGCGKIIDDEEDALWDADPYAEEIYGDLILGWWHPVCYNERALDI